MEPISSDEALDLLLDHEPAMYWNWQSVLLLIGILPIIGWGFWEDSLG